MIKYDIHIHTHLSSCAQRDAFMKDYIEKAKELGLELICFSDHSWEKSIEGASGWYAPQSYERLEDRRNELKQLDTKGIKVLLGAEGEYACELLALNENSLKYIDYIIVPHSHTHMKGFVLPQDCIGNPKKHSEYLVKSFRSLCNHELSDNIFGIAHPMYPINEKLEYVEECYSYISDEVLFELGKLAKNKNIALEANLSTLSSPPNDTCYKRFFDACKKAKCDFFLGSDAHSVKSLELHNRQEELLKLIGLDEEDFKAAGLRISNV